MKFKKFITILILSTMVLSNSVWSYAYEIPKDLEVQQEYSNMDDIMEQTPDQNTEEATGLLNLPNKGNEEAKELLEKIDSSETVT